LQRVIPDAKPRGRYGGWEKKSTLARDRGRRSVSHNLIGVTAYRLRGRRVHMHDRSNTAFMTAGACATVPAFAAALMPRRIALQRIRYRKRAERQVVGARHGRYVHERTGLKLGGSRTTYRQFQAVLAIPGPRRQGPRPATIRGLSTKQNRRPHRRTPQRSLRGGVDLDLADVAPWRKVSPSRHGVVPEDRSVLKPFQQFE